MDVSTRYGLDWAEDYDTVTPIPEHVTERTVGVLAELADDGPVLELAAGTGRLALGLAARGLDVTATDSSEPMLAKLRAKDPDGLIKTVCATMPDLGVDADEQYALIVCAYNSIIFLDDLVIQTKLFAQAAEHLRPGGYFVVESLLFDPKDFVEARPLVMNEDILLARFADYDYLTQILTQYHIVARSGQPLSLRPHIGRMVTPSETYLMAKLAGLRRMWLWRDWSKTALTGPGNTISVFQRPHSPGTWH